jgi:16S rRNA (cytosine1402-N4)-methyltransferase
VLLEQVLECLNPQVGEIAVDCTLGFAGHAVPMLQRLGSNGKLIGLDWDADHLPRAHAQLAATGLPFSVLHSNFAALTSVLANEGLSGGDVILADLGMSSMQVDDPERGFSYARDGPLDMRMDRTRGQSAADLLATIPEQQLEEALTALGDEPKAQLIARTVVEARDQGRIATTRQLAEIVAAAVGLPSRSGAGWRLRPGQNRWQSHPAARTFQVLRILVNRELANLQHLLRILPDCLRPGGRVGIISFHSGEDRLVKGAFREGLRAGVYLEIAPEPLRASFDEQRANPRSRSAKLRWAKRSSG